MRLASHSNSNTGLLLWRHGKLGLAWIGGERRQSGIAGAVGVVPAMVAETEIIAWTA